MQELIERLEKATGPNFALDWNIHLTAFGIEGAGMYGNHPNYTASIDAALTLVPDGSNLEQLGQFMCLGKDGQALWQARVRLRTLPSPFDKGKRGDRLESSGFMPSPAIALCIAALKARSVATVSTT